MSFIGSNILAGASGQGSTGYEIERSLRFNPGDSSYLSRTPSSAGNSKTFTFSCWVKRCADISSWDPLLTVWNGSNANSGTYMQFTIYSNNIGVVDNNAWYKRISAELRDFSAWYHIVFAIDTTQSVADDRIKIYLNGELQTTYIANSAPAQNSDFVVNSNIAHYIGQRQNAHYLNSYLADVYLIDGQALAPTDFGETDDNGVWQPKEFDGTYSAVVSGGTTTSLSQTGWNPAHSGNIWDGNASSASRATGYAGGTAGTVSFNPPLTNVTQVEIWTQNYVNYLNGTSVSTPQSVNGGWHTLYDNSGSPITLNSVGNAYDTNNTSTVDIAGIRINGTIVNAQTWTPPSGVGLASITTGANSFHLPFTDNSSNAALGTDTSGNNNTWTVNNLSAGGSDWDQSQAWSSGMKTTTTANTSYSTSGRTNTFPDSLAATNPFDADLTNYLYSQTGGAGTWLYVELGTALANVTSIVFSTEYSCPGGVIKLNGTNVAVNQSNLGGGFVEASVTGTIPASLTEIAIQGNGGSARLKYLKINGKYLIDSGVSDPLAAGTDSLVDSPTNGNASSGGDPGGAIVGNYCTLNPLDRQSTNGTLSNGNLDLKWPTASWVLYRSTMHVSSGKWYWEVTLGNNQYSLFGIIPTDYNMNTSTNYWMAQVPNAYSFYPFSGLTYANTSSVQYTSADTSASGTTYGIALDLDAGTLTYYKNGVSLGVAHTGISGSFSPAACVYSASNNDSYNFGQRAFNTAAPSGYKSLNTANLPEPTIEDGSKYFDTKLFNAANGTQTVSGYNFSPDLVWTKSRANAYAHQLWDQVRGANKALSSNETTAEANLSNSLTFTPDGFTSGTNNNANYGSGGSVAWAWDAGDSTTTIAAGSINSAVTNQAQTWSSNIATTGNSGSWWPSYPATYIFDANTSNYGHANGNGSVAAVVTLSFSPAVTCVSTVSFFGGLTGSGTGTISINGGTAFNLTTGSSATTKTTVAFSGSISSIVVTKTATGGEGLLCYGFEIDGVRLTDNTAWSIPASPSIASQVKASPESGFSIISYTGNSTTGTTIAHGLNDSPEFAIFKNRDDSLVWYVYHKDVGNTKYLRLNSDIAEVTRAEFLNNTSPTSSVFTLGSDAEINASGQDIICYAWTSVSGYSSVGSYTGNGSATDGTFVPLDFKPAFVMGKRTDGSSNWFMNDTSRLGYNPANLRLYPNLLNGEGSSTDVNMDMLSNGFKLYTTNTNSNGSGATYAYIAFAEHPFQTARAR